MTEHKHTNRLINETSPYLLQHAHNPVDWYPWGEAALTRARDEDKPILLSIGYSACHWCHVMERESFENEEIAQLMNEHFINIKVDREERPDLDQIYMNAVQAMTGHGGWPMTVFLTPAGVPFYGGTYFPPQDRYNLPGFPRILLGVADAYRNRRDELNEGAGELLAHLRQLNEFRSSIAPLTQELLDLTERRLDQNYDEVYGGFGTAPKFPASMTLMFLLRRYLRSADPDILNMVEHTLQRMGRGGIYDHLGGGFHRYSVDERWLVPHFEKMLYDNALLTRIYLYTYQATGNQFYRTIVEETLDYVVREMTDASGGFYSTQDADSEGEEGKFFVWTPGEIQALLGEDDAAIFNIYYGVSEPGNFEGKNILYPVHPPEAIARRLGIEVSELETVISRSRAKLFEAREQRIKPGRDEKILTGWNGLMLTAFAEAAAALDRADYREVARRNAEFILNHLRRDGRLLRTYKDGQARLNGYLEDYAYLSEGLLALYEATFETRWFEEARALADTMIDQFWDEAGKGFFFTGKAHESLITRNKDFMDNATPSGNSTATHVLLKLFLYTGDEAYEKKVTEVFQLLRDPVEKYPSAFSYLLCAVSFYLSSPKEIAIIGRPEQADTRELLQAIQARYLPDKVVAAAAPDDDAAPKAIPLLADRPQLDGKATAYVCQNFSCQLPVTSAIKLLEQLGVT